MPGLGTVTLTTPTITQLVRPSTSNVIVWTVTNTKLTNYTVERKIGAGAWGDYDTVAAGTLSYTDASSSADATYNYRVRANRGGRQGAVSNEVQIVVGAGGGGGGTTITESDLTYLGAYDLPDSVGGIGVTFTECPIALRNGEMLHVTADQPVSSPGARLFQVVIPALKTSDWNTASVSKNFGDIYQTKRVHADTSTYNWVYGLYADPDNPNDVYWNYGAYYSGDTSSPSFGRSVLNDAASTGTAEGAWLLDGVNNRFDRTGCLRMPAAFVTANCPGKPFLVGFGGVSFAIAGGSSCGPAFMAVPRPVLVTHPHESALPNDEALSYPYTATLYGTPPRGRREDDYGGGLYGTAGHATTPGIATADGSSVTLPTSVYDNNYTGAQLSITSGAAQQTVTLGAKTGTRKFSVTWTNGTPAADSSFEVVYSPAGSNVFNGEWPPLAGVGYYTLGDRVGGAAWVRGTPRGILVFVTRAVGKQFYGPGGPHYEAMRHTLEVYDEDDLAAVLAGSINGYDVEPVARWNLEIPGLTYPNTTSSLQGWWWRIGGVAYDDANRKVYVAVNNHRFNGSASIPRIHCYQIGGSN
jgi:hypothetical protein